MLMRATPRARRPAAREEAPPLAVQGQPDLFADLGPADRQAFLAKCRQQQFARGEHLFAQGEPYTTSYLIRSGVVRTYYIAPSGKEITIAYWSPGTMVGGPNVFRENRPHIWSAQAASEVVAECVRGRDLEELSLELPQLAHYLIETLTFKLEWTSLLLQTFGTQSVQSRLAHLLLQLGERYGVAHSDGTLIAHHFSHDELARMVGATRSWVTLAIRNLKKSGIVACSGRHLIVRDRAGLEKVALDRRR
jgi:CRP-like cAMP-binding protein